MLMIGNINDRLCGRKPQSLGDQNLCKLEQLPKDTEFYCSKNGKIEHFIVIRNDFVDTGLVLVKDSNGQYKEEDGLMEVYVL